MSEFYLTLPSNSSMEYYPENTLTSFTTRLPNSISLEGDWDVGLVEIQYPHNWYNIPEDIQKRTFTLKISENRTNQINTHFSIDKGYYPTITHVVDTIAKKINNATNQTTQQIIMTYDEITGKVKGSFEYDLNLKTSNHIQKMLGLDNPSLNMERGREWEASYEADLDPMDSLYVYCDILEPRVVGDTLAPLVRIVPVEGKHGDLITRIYENVHYIRVQKKNFQTVEINIRDRTGKKVSFEPGTLNITLHFRRRKRLSTL